MANADKRKSQERVQAMAIHRLGLAGRHFTVHRHRHRQARGTHLDARTVAQAEAAWPAANLCRAAAEQGMVVK